MCEGGEGERAGGRGGDRLQHAVAHIRRAEDNLWKSVPSFHPDEAVSVAVLCAPGCLAQELLDSSPGVQVSALYLLSHLAGSSP